MGHELVPSQENDPLKYARDFNMKRCLMYLYLEVESLRVLYSHICSQNLQTSFSRIFVWLVACLIVVKSRTNIHVILLSHTAGLNPVCSLWSFIFLGN